MENENLIVKISSLVSNLPINIESKNTIKIYLNEVTRELIEDESGMVTHLQSYGGQNSHIRLHPCCLMPSHLTQLLRDQHVPYSDCLGQEIATGIVHSLVHDDSLRQPVFVTVNVKFIQERRLILPPVVSASRGASRDVFQRLVEEQRVESTDLKEDETCSICIEDLSENIIIRMPRCLHMFHQGCLFEWLGRQNSCPLCRRVPYEEETQILA